jgi:hypothetical protein
LASSVPTTAREADTILGSGVFSKTPLPDFAINSFSGAAVVMHLMSL